MGFCRICHEVEKTCTEGLFFPFWDSGTQKTASHSSARPVCCNRERIHRILVCLRVLARERCVAGSHAVSRRPSDLRRSYGDTDGELDAFGVPLRRGRFRQTRSRADGQPRVPRVECRFSGWIFSSGCATGCNQLAQRSFVEIATGCRWSACSVMAVSCAPRYALRRQARFSETRL